MGHTKVDKYMKPFFIVTALSLLLSATAFSQPKMKIPTGDKFTFGDIVMTSKVEKSITIKNLGKDTLIISDIGATCGCTAAMMSNNRIAPRESGMLNVTFDASRFSGLVEKGVNFHTNDPKNQVVSLKFTANVVRVIELDPEYLMFSHGVVDSPMTVEVTIKNISEKPIKILSVKSASGIITTNLSTKVIEPNQEAQLECTLTPKTAGTTKGYIELKTDNPKLRSHNIRFFAFAKSKK